MTEALEQKEQSSQKKAHPRVMVVTSGARLAMQTTLALQEEEILRGILMSFYFKEKRLFTRALASLPIGRSILREMKRRHLEGLDEELVFDHPYVELPYMAIKKAPVGNGIRKLAASLRDRALLTSYKNTLVREKPHAIIAPDGWLRNLSKTCKQNNILQILDQNTGHITAMAKTLHEERELHPDFADSISPFSEKDIAECTEEALEAHAIFVSSQFAKDSLLDIGVPEERIHLIQYAADTERFHPLASKPQSENVRFIFVGLIGQRKGIKYLLEAFKGVSLPKAELELVGVKLGSGEGLRPYKDLFIHTPSVPYQEIHKTFQQADVFVMPTLHESGVLAIHEALASGLPVITTPNAGSIVRDGKDGFIVPIRDVEALKEKIELLYSNNELREEMSKNARARALEFTWERYRRRIGETVRRLVEATL